jgi:hypothetical protein
LVAVCAGVGVVVSDDVIVGANEGVLVALVLGACVGPALVGSKLGATLGMVDTTSLGAEEELNVGRLDIGTLGIKEEVNIGALDGDTVGLPEVLSIEEGDPVGTPTVESEGALVVAPSATALGTALDEATGEALGLDEADTDGERLT